MTRADALAHPTWQMGPKITVDSATLANKGLELIEAHFLFGLPYEQIEVVVHPTSVVHAIVRFRDGASLAHLGYPDMRVPISYALTYPERAATPVERLDFSEGLTLEFEPPGPRDVSRCSRSPARPASRAERIRARSTPRTRSQLPRSSPAGCRSSTSPASSQETLEAVDGAPAADLEELVEADAEARRLAENAVGALVP